MDRPASDMPRPWISANLAISADGKISSVRRDASGWTSGEDHRRLVELRKQADALMVGRATLEADQMKLTVPGRARQPLRCIISRRGGLSPDLPVFHHEGGPVHLLVADTSRGRAFPSPPEGVRVHHGDLEGFLEILGAELGVERLHCEGGGELIRSLAELDVIDEFHLTLAGHTVYGGGEAPSATGVPVKFLPRSLKFELVHFDPRPELGECFLTYRRAGR